MAIGTEGGVAMELQRLLSFAGILIGAAVMLASIIKAGGLMRALPLLRPAHRAGMGLLLRTHRGLMGFFLLGYAAVLLTFFLELHLVSDLFVSAIFMFGALFVLMGIVIQSRMISRMQSALEEVGAARGELEERVILRTAELTEANQTLKAEVASRQAAEGALRESEAMVRTIFDTVRAGIMVVDAQTHTIHDCNTYVTELLGMPKNQVVGRSCQGFICPATAGACPVTDLGQTVHMARRTLLKGDPRAPAASILKSVVRIERNGRQYVLESFIDNTEREKAEKEVAALHQRLVEQSRQAGMAEVAISVLHNVGNVLNSVNVSTTLLKEQARRSGAGRLRRVVSLLREHRDDLADFLTRDPKGKQLETFLALLAEELEREQTRSLAELGSLSANVEHINQIVAMQQNYARAAGVHEWINPADLMEDALRVNSDSLGRHEIVVRKEFGQLPRMAVDKHKVLQILVNLISNARHACVDSASSPKEITLGVSRSDGHVRFIVADNGAGIAPGNLTRIFSHGFTTRKDGHGFGLHSGALAARELGGSLTARSDGPGRGATFILELPLTAAANGDEPVVGADPAAAIQAELARASAPGK
jgi:signal transduction histidine kinase